jgi:hypothetical protein
MQNKHVGYIAGGFLAAALAFVSGEAQAVQPDYNSLRAAGITREQFEGNKRQGKYIMPDKEHWEGALEPGENFDNFAKGSQKWAEDFFARKFSDKRFRNALESYAKTRNIKPTKVASPCKLQFLADYTQELEKELQELENLYESRDKEFAELREKDRRQDSRIKELEERPIPGQKDYSQEMDELEDEIQYLKDELESLKSVYAQPPAEEGYGGLVQPGYVVGALPAYPFGVGPIFEYYVWGGSIFCWDSFHHGFHYFGRLRDYDWDFHGKLWKSKHSGLGSNHRSDRIGPGLGGHRDNMERRHGRDPLHGRRPDLPGRRFGFDGDNRVKKKDSDRRADMSRKNNGLKNFKNDSKLKLEGFVHEGFGRQKLPNFNGSDLKNRGSELLQGHDRQMLPKEYKQQHGLDPHLGQSNLGRMEHRVPQGFPQGGTSRSFQNFQPVPQQINPGRGPGNGMPSHPRSGGRR